jgi:hypothetical protein
VGEEVRVVGVGGETSQARSRCLWLAVLCCDEEEGIESTT